MVLQFRAHKFVASASYTEKNPRKRMESKNDDYLEIICQPNLILLLGAVVYRMIVNEKSCENAGVL